MNERIFYFKQSRTHYLFILTAARAPGCRWLATPAPPAHHGRGVGAVQTVPHIEFRMRHTPSGMACTAACSIRVGGLISHQGL